MRIVRFLSGGQVHLGQDVDGRSARVIDGNLFGQHRVTDRVLPVEKLLAPLVPVDILCIGINYREHAAESGSAVPQNPVLFIKASNTLNNPGDPIPIPKRSDKIDYEGELAVVIGRDAKHVSRTRARLRLRLHHRQRRLRPRLAAPEGTRRRAVRARQEF